jgi:hypothetical protein
VCICEHAECEILFPQTDVGTSHMLLKILTTRLRWLQKTGGTPNMIIFSAWILSLICGVIDRIEQLQIVLSIVTPTEPYPGVHGKSTTLGQKRFVLAAKTGFCWRARHPPATLSQ